MKKKTEKKVVEPKAPVAPVAPKVMKEKKPKFKLVSYEIKAIIPTGMYSNIQPCVIVESDTLENAERAVMPHIEALFAKYRTEGAMTVTPVKPVAPVVAKPEATTDSVHAEQLKRLGVTPEVKPVAPVAPVVQAPAPVAPVAEAPAIALTVPFTRAKTAIESCTSREALDLIESQVHKSVKLIDTEKQTLYTDILMKRKTFNG